MDVRLRFISYGLMAHIAVQWTQIDFVYRQDSGNYHQSASIELRRARLLFFIHPCWMSETSIQSWKLWNDIVEIIITFSYCLNSQIEISIWIGKWIPLRLVCAFSLISLWMQFSHQLRSSLKICWHMSIEEIACNGCRVLPLTHSQKITN